MLGASPVDTDDVRARASEIKFLIDAECGRRIRAWARAQLQPDPHGTGAHGDGYATRTLYFETRESDVLARRGSYSRAKYRVRRYGAGEVAFLERKLRRRNMLVKRRTEVPLPSLARLAGHIPSGTWEGAWFERRLRCRGLAPVCQVGYRRTARFTRTDSGVARLTIDEGVAALALSDTHFVDEPGLPLLDGREILEMKFRDALPPVFARLVHEFGLLPQAVSKYRLGMAALGHLPMADETGAMSAEGVHV